MSDSSSSSSEEDEDDASSSSPPPPPAPSTSLLQLASLSFVDSLFRYFEPEDLNTLTRSCRHFHNFIDQHRHRLRRSSAFSVELELREASTERVIRFNFTNRNARSAHFTVLFTRDLPQPSKQTKYVHLTADDAILFAKIRPGERCVRVKTATSTGSVAALKAVFRFITRHLSFEDLEVTDVDDRHIRVLTELYSAAELHIREFTLSDAKWEVAIEEASILAFLEAAKIERFAADDHPPSSFSATFFDQACVRHLRSFEMGVDLDNEDSECVLTDAVLGEWTRLDRLVVPYVHTPITAEGLMSWISRKLDSGQELDRVSVSVPEAVWTEISEQLFLSWHLSKFRHEDRLYFQTVTGYTLRLSRGIEIGGRLRFCADVS